MVNKYSVFILGAGASKPYGYLPGDDLRQNILNNLDRPNSKQFEKLIQLGYSREQVGRFRGALLGDRVSPTIDVFLANRKNDKEFTDIGKAAIAQVLIPFEKSEILLNDKEDKWYVYFFNNILNNNKNCDKIEENKVTIITFNYDRSFEQFLIRAMIGLSKNYEECITKLEKMDIIHFHGQLGDIFPQSSQNYRSYDHEYTIDGLRRAIAGINIPHEFESLDILSENPNFNRAYKAIQKTENIFFLGFGYDITNLNRLRIDRHLNKNVYTIMGTAFGKEKAEKEIIIEYFKKFKKEIILKEEKNLSFLRKEVISKLGLE